MAAAAPKHENNGWAAAPESRKAGKKNSRSARRQRREAALRNAEIFGYTNPLQRTIRDLRNRFVAARDTNPDAAAAIAADMAGEYLQAASVKKPQSNATTQKKAGSYLRGAWEALEMAYRVSPHQEKAAIFLAKMLNARGGDFRQAEIILSKAYIENRDAIVPNAKAEKNLLIALADIYDRNGLTDLASGCLHKLPKGTNIPHDLEALETTEQHLEAWTARLNDIEATYCEVMTLEDGSLSTTGMRDVAEAFDRRVLKTVQGIQKTLPRAPAL